MRRKLLTQLMSAQAKLNRSKQITSARIKQAAHDNDFSGLHEALARGWKLEYQIQENRRKLHEYGHNQIETSRQRLESVLDDCQVSLRHASSSRVVRFSTLLATDVSIGLIGMDTRLGQSLHGAKLMSLVSMPTPLGQKTYQITAITPLRINLAEDDQSPNAKDRSIGTGMREASVPADMPRHSPRRRRPSES